MFWTKRRLMLLVSVLVCVQCSFWFVWLHSPTEPMGRRWTTSTSSHQNLLLGGDSERRTIAFQDGRNFAKRSSNPETGRNSGENRRAPPESRKLKTSSNSDLRMVVGIVTAERRPPTVLKMMRMLIADLDFNRFRVVVWQSISIRDPLIKQVLENMGAEVYGPAPPYEALQPDKIRMTYNDTLERVRWRTNHVLDYANLLEQCLKSYSSAKYFLILEDDVWPAKHAVEKSYDFAEDNFGWRTNWGFLTLYSGKKRSEPVEEVKTFPLCGAVALLYHRAILQLIIDFLRQYPYLAPVDLLIPSLLIRQLKLRVYERTPNLFQHAGYNSSYSGKDAKDRGSQFWRSRTYMRDEDNTTHQQHDRDPVTGYIGCFIDHSNMHDLDGLYASVGSKHAGSPAKCKLFCRDYSYFGLQGGGECLCGNQFGMYGKVNDEKCNLPCRNQWSFVCGGHGYNSIFIQTSRQVRYLGCYKDSRQRRDFTRRTSYSHHRAPKLCSQFCEADNSRYFGLQYGGECFCSNTYGMHGRVSESMCNVPCKDDAQEKCGGRLVNSVYEIL